MNDAKSYAAPVEIGGVMVGGVVGEVVESNHPKFAAGDIVQGEFGWQEYTISNGKGVRKIDPDDRARSRPRWACWACRA